MDSQIWQSRLLLEELRRTHADTDEIDTVLRRRQIVARLTDAIESLLWVVSEGPLWVQGSEGTARASAAAPTAINTATGSIAGTVTDNPAGTPVEFVEVLIYDSTGSFVGLAETAPDGSYQFDGLANGSYFARTSDFLGRYINEVYDDIQCAPFCDVTTGTPIAVTAGLTTSGIDFSLVFGGSISGTVTEDLGGAPIPDIEVAFFDSNGFLIGGHSGTETDGSYQFGGLATGTYFAHARDPSGGFINELYDDIVCAGPCFDPPTPTPIAVTAGATTAGIDFALAVAGKVSGIVTEDPAGPPIQNVNVDILDMADLVVNNALTDADGSYEVGGLPPDSYLAGTLDFRVPNGLFISEVYDDLTCVGLVCNDLPGVPTPIPVMAGSTTSGIDFALTLGGGISGAVTADNGGAPIPFEKIAIFDSTGVFVISDFTNSAGEYLFRGLPAGTYYARVDASASGFVPELYDNVGCAGLSCDVTTGTAIVVAAGSTTSGIDFALALGGGISGTVTADPGGAPIENVEVEIFDSMGGFISNAFTAADGSYGIQGLPAASYFALASGSGYIAELYDDLGCAGFSCDVTTGTPIVVAAGSTTSGIDFALQVDPGCVADLVVANQTLSGMQTLKATLTATLGPNLIVSGDDIAVQAPVVSVLNDTSISGPFTIGNNPSCP